LILVPSLRVQGVSLPSVDEELRRLIPVLEGACRLRCTDFGRHLQAGGDAAALRHGASMINDIYALRMPGALRQSPTATVQSA
jgi:dihydropteroate synthase